ncbi:hypothetical protein FJQ98_20575 [Lysinibacillus agricola]|uniref:Uncharacterized protein n=1 Tax=Lysinibacillus agricola TaxID=2590012 RepID=A0ABX7ANP5_9BACI|nr:MULTISPECIES: hypothetical protein [Lysinibacillus]KOS60883.1 hypothetical protein AN161_20085 [Lysinibacillus sp. FJAT-14222]QQP11566.1 hypothetical protein FJQ98_20575 [Lysinibacillus agricola]
MTTVKTIDWSRLNGKVLKIYVTEPNEAVIGIDEETGKSYMLRQEKPVFFLPGTLTLHSKKRSWFGRGIANDRH